MRQLFFRLMLVIAFVGAQATMMGQSTITGKITDGETGEPLRGASVSVVEVKKGAYSDTKGTFTVKKVPAGTYTVKVSFVGYETKVFEKVTVTDGTPVELNVVLGMTKSAAQEVVVEATRHNDNAAALLAQRQKAAQVSDGIGREEITKLPDSDAGQALKRVSGVTLVDGKYVYVRGVSDRYSNTTLNGASLTSTEADKRSFTFDLFPSDLLESANVAKSFTPDLPGNFVGGLVQLNTVDFPSGNTAKASMGASGNDYVTFHSNEFNSYSGGSSDWLAKDDGSRAAASNLPANKSEMTTLVRSAQGGDEAAIEEWTSIGKGFNNPGWARQNFTAPINGSGSISGSGIIDVGETDKFGVVASLNYGNDFQIKRTIRRANLTGDQLLYDYSGSRSIHNVGIGGLLNMAYRVGESSTLSLKNTYSRSADDETTYLYGEEYAQSQLRKYISYHWTEKELLANQLSGEHIIGAWNSTVVDWKAGYSQSHRDEPDYRRLRYQRNSGDVGNPMEVAIPFTTQGSSPDASRFYSAMQEYGRTASANVSIPVSSLKIKVGGLYDSKNRSFNARSFTIIQNPTGEIDNLLFITDSNAVPDPEPLFADSNYTVNRLGMSEDTRLSDQYSGTEVLGAAYAMVDVPFDVSGLPIRFIGGARVEDNTIILDGWDSQDNQVNVNLPYTDVLPSVNLIVSPVASMNIRASATQTLTRPTFRELAPFAFYDYDEQAIVSGNPNLQRALVQNYDLRWEYFVAPGEVISVSGFYKNFKNAIEQTIQNEASEIRYSFANASADATNYGVELEIRKNLGFIADPLRYLVLSFNGALIASEVEVVQNSGTSTITDVRPMWGQSPYTINVGLFYQNPYSGTAITVGYNRSGRRIMQVGLVGGFGEGVDPHAYELPRDVVDFSVIQPFGPLEFKFAMRDVLNQALQREQLGRVIRSDISGRGYSIGISYRFNQL
jgi:TonB-dependent receptor